MEEVGLGLMGMAWKKRNLVFGMEKVNFGRTRKGVE
jgi:hypothetical protein